MTEPGRRRSIRGLVVIAILALLVAGVAPVVAEHGVSDSKARDRTVKTGIINVPTRCTGGERKKLSMYLVDEGTSEARDRVVSGAPRFVTYTTGTEVERAEPDQPVTMKFTEDDAGYFVRFVTPEQYASGILKIRVGEQYMYHLLDTNSFALDISGWLQLGPLGLTTVELELVPMDLALPAPPLSMTVEIAKDGSKATIKF